MKNEDRKFTLTDWNQDSLIVTKQSFGDITISTTNFKNSGVLVHLNPKEKRELIEFLQKEED